MTPRRPSRLNRAVKRTIAVVIVLLIVIYGVGPQIGEGRRGIDRLANVNPALVMAAFALSIASLVAYSLMTRATLPHEPHIRLFTLFHIQLSTKALSNVVPGGSAAGSTLGYRLFTAAGVPGPAAGFTLGTVGLGSAVVLNLMLWLALLVSIPFNGFRPVYVSAAIVGAILMAAAGAIVALLMRGAERGDRAIRAIARKLPKVDEDTASRFALQTAHRLHDLAGQPELIRHSMSWAAVNWLLDAASLWVLLYAFGQTMNPLNVFVAYGLVNILAAIPLTPGGLGVVETALPGLLIGFGAAGSVATIAVLSWRFFQYLIPIPAGFVAYTSLRLGGLGRAQRELERNQHLLDDIGIDRRVWDEASGQFRAVDADEIDHLLATPADATPGDQRTEPTPEPEPVDEPGR